MGQEDAGFAWTTVTTPCSLRGCWACVDRADHSWGLRQWPEKRITLLAGFLNSVSHSLSFHGLNSLEVAT